MENITYVKSRRPLRWGLGLVIALLRRSGFPWKTIQAKTPNLKAEGISLVSSRIFGWNSLTEDLIALYTRLVDLGMEYRDGKVYLFDLEELEDENV